jgi:hypothetical protein
MATIIVVHPHQIENPIIDDIIIIIVVMIIRLGLFYLFSCFFLCHEYYLDHVLVAEVDQDLDVVVNVDVEVLAMHMINQKGNQ